MDDGEQVTGAEIRDTLWSLPLIDQDLYLRMQATNLAMVDDYLRELEAQLLHSYFEQERTPPETVFVSALSQLWIFGIYELLRTWRQRMRDVLAFAEKMEATDEEELEAALTDQRAEYLERTAAPEDFADRDFGPYERAVQDLGFRDDLITAYDASELLFRRLEALRVSLAKHEIPRNKGSQAFAPGYGRIDMASGSILWQVSLGKWEVDTVSRRAISDDLPTLAESIEHNVIPRDLQPKLHPIEKTSYALKQVVVVLGDDREYPGTLIAWNKIVVAVLGLDEIPFDAMEIVDVRPDPDAEPISQAAPPSELLEDF